jgi:hypothetical protein
MENITTIDVINRTHLRFIKVTDDKKLEGILDKILQSLVVIYLERDMANVGANIAEHPKGKVLDELMTHL